MKPFAFTDESHEARVALALLLTLLVYGRLPVPLWADESPSVETSTDQTLFPKAYGILANERLMFPVDMSDWPVKITVERQLFVDDYLIASSSHVTRTVHQVKKYADNPIMADHAPWEGKGPAFQIVRRDSLSGKFRMLYTGTIAYVMPSGVRGVFPALYAESDDGIHWKRPDLGLFEFNGSNANNIVIPAGNLFGLHIDCDEPNPQRRYKGVVDAVRSRIVWEKTQVIELPDDEPVRLEFELKDARLYAFWIE